MVYQKGVIPRGGSRIPRRRERQPSRRGRQHTNLPDFSVKNCMKIENILGRGWGGAPPWICHRSPSVRKG